MSLAEPRPNLTCPLCGGPNGCAPAASGSFETPCWCKDASFAAQLFERVPDSLQGRACICRACAASGSAASTGSVSIVT